jgi:hypothetical protein
MDSISLKLTLGSLLLMWLLVCALVYRMFRSASWLASPSVASCIFLLGATVAASFFVPEAFFLAPLWIGVFILAAIHLWKANNQHRSEASSISLPDKGSVRTPHIHVSQKEQPYI